MQAAPSTRFQTGLLLHLHSSTGMHDSKARCHQCCVCATSSILLWRRQCQHSGLLMTFTLSVLHDRKVATAVQ